jgi:ArsR family transcriptional regulator
LRELEHYFKALADSTRLRILNLLLHGELCVCDIQHVLDAAQPTVSRHLAYLRNAGLVRDRRDGYRIFYRLADQKDSAKRLLYRFLREIGTADDTFDADNRQLRSVIKAGACTLSEWKPYSAMAEATSRAGSTHGRTPRT